MKKKKGSQVVKRAGTTGDSLRKKWKTDIKTEPKSEGCQKNQFLIKFLIFSRVAGSAGLVAL